MPMGFRDPNALDWEIEYWDEYLQEFGPIAYVQARYGASERATMDEGIVPAETAK